MSDPPIVRRDIERQRSLSRLVGSNLDQPKLDIHFRADTKTGSYIEEVEKTDIKCLKRMPIYRAYSMPLSARRAAASVMTSSAPPGIARLRTCR